jgi:hypothetical protein
VTISPDELYGPIIRLMRDQGIPFDYGELLRKQEAYAKAPGFAALADLAAMPSAEPPPSSPSGS